jgi:ABC-type lipoprotein export system ATPase subunit
VALDKVNLALPNTGMVFIIGKSGSGKSTLLNMLGGLDSFDGGSIIADGNDLSRFSSRSFYKYRASYVGFIFQDYHLIDELTVKENINLEAEIANVGDVNIDQALKAVDLEGYGARFPEELSGGQKQRVAIARALIKSPKVVLCDEPTGNLDKATSTQIMELLSSISKERLVVIVSHNMPDAEKYADRIIELSDGKIISDLSRKGNYKNNLFIKNGTLSLPYNHNFTREETLAISKVIAERRIHSVVQNDGGYESTKEVAYQAEKTKLRDSKMKTKSILKLFSAFSRVGKLRTATTAFISAVMVVLLIIIQSFLMFDGSAAIKKSLENSSGGTVVLKKDSFIDEYGLVDNSRLFRVTDADLAKIDEISGEQTKKYLLYNYSITVDPDDPAWKSELEQQYRYNFEKKHLYSSQMPGILVCDEDYLIRKFGQNGTLNVLAGDIKDSKDGSKIILTDYLADALMTYSPAKYRSYQSILGNLEGRCYVAAIIDTGYKVKYADLITKIFENNGTEFAGISSLDKESAALLLDDIKNNLSIGYSINPDFHTAAVMEDTKYYSRVAGFDLFCGETSTYIELGDALEDKNGTLNPGETILSIRLLEQLFPGKSQEEFTFPMEITMKRYEYPSKDSKIIAEFNFTVVGTAPASASYFYSEDYRKLKDIDIIPFAVYIEDYENINDTMNLMAERYFSWNSSESETVTLLNKSVNMFFDLFRLI